MIALIGTLEPINGIDDLKIDSDSCPLPAKMRACLQSSHAYGEFKGLSSIIKHRVNHVQCCKSCIQGPLSARDLDVEARDGCFPYIATYVE